MSIKEQIQKREKAISKQRSSQQTTRNFGSFACCGDTSAIIQRAQRDPRSLDQQEVQHLQSTIGNQAVQRFFQGSGDGSQGSGKRIQAKLKIGQPNDKYEQEADMVADQVMRMDERKETQPISDLAQISRIQRICPECEEEMHRQPIEENEEELQQQPIEDEEEKMVQQKIDSTQTPEVTADLESRIQSQKGGGQLLPESERDFYGSSIGADFSNVKIHTDAGSNKLNRELNARAFTTGQDIFFAEGQYVTGMDEGRQLLAHELAHVVQQGTAKSSGPEGFPGTLVHRSVVPAVQRTPAIPAAVGAALAAVGRFLLACIIGAAFGVGLDYVIQRGVAWWRNQRFRWNTCYAAVSAVIGCVSAGVGSIIARALFRSTGGHLERGAVQVAVWVLTWLYSKFPVVPIAIILKQLVKLGCVDASELPPGVQAE